jgi:hypothetical protein
MNEAETTMPQAKSLSLDEFPDYREVATKRRELHTEAKALEVQAEELQDQLYRAGEASGDNPLDAEAAKLLNGAGTAPLDSSAADLLTQLNQVRRKQAVLQRARQLFEPKFEEIRGERAAELARRMVPRHRSAVERIAAALRELEAANRAEEAVRFELQQAGISNEMLVPAASFPNIGRSVHPNAPIARWRAWAAGRGFNVDAED